MQGSPHVQTCVSARYATISARYAKKRADTHFFVPDTHNVIMMVWLRIILHDAACMSGENLDEKAVIVRHFFVSHACIVHHSMSALPTLLYARYIPVHTYSVIQCTVHARSSWSVSHVIWTAILYGRRTCTRAHVCFLPCAEYVRGATFTKVKILYNTIRRTYKVGPIELYLRSYMMKKEKKRKTGIDPKWFTSYKWLIVITTPEEKGY